MKHTQLILMLTAAAAVALGVVYLMVGPGSDLVNRPLAIAGMGLIGLGLTKASRRKAVAQRA